MKNVQIDDQFDDLLQKLKKRLNKPKKQIVEEAIKYIDHNKINPSDFKEGDPTQAIKQFGNTVVGFIRTQEKDHLIPIVEELRKLDLEIRDHMKVLASSKALNNGLNVINNNVNKNTVLIEGLKKDRDRAAYRKYIEEAENKLKNKFSQILEEFSEDRNKLNSLTDKTAIRELLENNISKIKRI